MAHLPALRTTARRDGDHYVVVDAHAPGVTVRPLRDLTGAENDGWRLVRTSLGHERAAGALNQASTYRRVRDELVALARERGATADPLVRDRLARFEVDVRINELRTALRAVTADATEPVR